MISNEVEPGFEVVVRCSGGLGRFHLYDVPKIYDVRYQNVKDFVIFQH